jgi:hypothetical protein
MKLTFRLELQNINIIIISIITFITCMQGTYIPETNHVSRVYSVVAVLYLQFVLQLMLFCTLNMFCTLLGYCLNDSEMVTVNPIIIITIITIIRLLLLLF